MNAFFTSLAGTVEPLNVYHEGDELAEQHRRDPTTWLSSLAATIDHLVTSSTVGSAFSWIVSDAEV